MRMAASSYRREVVTMKALFILLLLTVTAQAGEQTRFYGPNGRSLGTAVTDSGGSRVFRDDRGRTIGTSSTTSGGITYYDRAGRIIGKTVR